MTDVEPRGGDLASRLSRRWRSLGWTDPGARVVVAVSGGLDSLVLLHLLRFRLPELGLELLVAHFDHGMRRGSRGDARWVRGLADAWGIPFRSERAEAPPAGEAAARALRYGFLHEVMIREDARRILTAHHADDQMETVVFRLLRGTGIRGLGGIPRERGPGILRPLLDEPRRELEHYASAVGLHPRADPTNVELHWARNRIRHRVLPAMEEVHPGARTSLLRVSRNARRASEALDALLGPVVKGVILEDAPDRITVDRDRILTYPSPVQGLILRAVANKGGLRLDETGTEGALEFIRTGPSGGRWHLPGSARLSRDFERLHFEWDAREDPQRKGSEGEPDAPFVVSRLLPPGEGEARLAGRRIRIRWGDEEPGDEPEMARAGFDPEALELPVTVRRWRSGDRTRGPVGSRKLKKVFGELKVPREERRRVPVVQDGRGEVIWVPGLYRAWIARPGTSTRTWYLGILNDDRDA